MEIILRLIWAIIIFVILTFDIGILFYFKDELKGKRSQFRQVVFAWLLANATAFFLLYWVFTGEWLFA